YFYDTTPVGFFDGTLWRTDGTAAGTFPLIAAEPNGFVGYNGRFFFAGCDAASGCEPYVTDGTVAGTVRLADVSPGSEPAGCQGGRVCPVFTLLGSAVFFEGESGFPHPLYVTDGTPAGTTPILDVPGAQVGANAHITDKLVAGAGA